MGKSKAKLKVISDLKLNLGCGKSQIEGFDGVDVDDYGQKHVLDLRDPWPWDDGSVEQVHCSHFVEHLNASERAHFVNELYRVMSPTASAQIIVPHWASVRAYGDLTHQWPPVCEMWFNYLSKEWRDVNAPHNNKLYSCDFEIQWGYSMHPTLVPRNQDYQQHAIQFWVNAIQDIVATFKKRAM